MDSEILEKDASTKDSSTKDASTKDVTKSKTIKHIVIPGGGGTGFIAYGALKESHAQGLWNIENIESIYGTSIGAIFAVVLALKYEWQILDDYLIKRPWQNIFKFNLQSFLQVFDKRGIYDTEVMYDIFKPLLNGLDLSINITMRELYEFSGIEIHIYTTDLNSFECVDISHKTHPEWRVVEAVYSSCTLPILFSPLIKENSCYIDGGFLNDYPLMFCINDGALPEEIFGIKKENLIKKVVVNSNSTFFDYLIAILQSVLNKILGFNEYPKIPYEIIVRDNPVSIESIIELAHNMDKRELMINCSTPN
jgi:predicted acylesterase/phospholipase RssA